MKALKILSIIFAILTILIGFGPIMRDTSLIEKIDQQMGLISSFSPALAEMAMKESGMPSTTTLYIGLAIVSFISVLSLIGMIMCFRKDSKLMWIGLSLIILALISIIVHPSIKVSENGGATPRLAAMLQGIPAILTGLLMYFYSTKLKRN